MTNPENWRKMERAGRDAAKLTPTEQELLHDTLGAEDRDKDDAWAAEADALRGPSAPTDRTDTRPVIYAWQMLDADEEWRIIGMAMVPGGPSLPIITTDINMAWEAIEVAQAHANRANTRCRLAAYVYDSDLAIVDPEGSHDA